MAAVDQSADPASTPAQSEPGSRVLSSFEFDASEVRPWMATPVVNGHKVTTASAFDVHMAWNEIPTVTLTLAAADALRLIFADKAALVKVGDETREALISLGWAPPAD